MCGFVGIFSPRAPVYSLDVDISAGMAAIRHRGPDGSGFFESPDDLFRVGFRRLSIIDIENSQQPILHPSGERVMVGNGEIYNFIELRERFADFPYQTSGDMETVLAAMDEQGEAFIQALTGMFALGIFDMRENQLTLARDHTGIKPLYWASRPDGAIGFSSEIKSLFAANIVLPEIDEVQVTRYLAQGYVPGPATLFKGVKKLDPGSLLTVDRHGKQTHETYWRPTVPTPDVLRPEDALDGLMESLRKSIRQNMRADVPVGALLSGGLDSGLLVALASEVTPHPLTTLTVRFDGAGYDEAPLARMVAERYGTDHHEVTIGRNAVDETLVDAVWHLGEPLYDAALVPNYIIQKEMSRHAKVSLNGTGGDELFAGYDRYFPTSIERQYGLVPKWVRAGIVEPLIAKLSPMTAWKLRRAEKFRSDPGGYLFDHCTPFPDVMLDMIGHKSRTQTVAQQEYFADYTGEPQSGMLYADVKTYLPDDLLTLLDRTSMAASVEGRVPFLDHKLVEYALSLPRSLRTPNGLAKELERTLAAPYLPEPLLSAPKQGFTSPVPVWMTGSFSQAAKRLLTRPQALERGWWNTSGVSNLFANPGKHGYRIYALLALELTTALYVDRGDFNDMPGVSLTNFAESV